ncbi:MAG: 5'-3' exonuclease [Candidatus Levyibacteriota bacterium]
MKLLLIDGNAILHRAYHAYPPLTNDKGQLVNAVYGFFAMLIKVIEEVKPTHLVICFDKAAPTFRKALYAGYQAKRPKMADDLSSQVSLLHEAIHGIHMQIFEVDGYEADDLIGTLSRQAKENEMETIIVSGDRDLLQLVNGKVKVMMPITGISKTVVMGEQEVEEKYGIAPKQFIDYKALVGDASDGYPGVTGIGPKTAATLIKKFGSFEDIYKHLADIDVKLSEKLATDAEQAALAKKLATIALDAPVTLDIDACKFSNIKREDADKVVGTFSFKSLKSRLGVFGEKKEESIASPQLELL